MIILDVLAEMGDWSVCGGWVPENGEDLCKFSVLVRERTME